jgi:hypothetical protein
MQQAFRGRKKDPTQNVMVVVDFDLKFTYVLAGWEGFAHDALILSDAIERQDGFTMPLGTLHKLQPIVHVIGNNIESLRGICIPL